MVIEIDQSGRVEDLSTGTAIAFANGEHGAVFISAGVKRRLIIYLRQKSFLLARDLPALLFAVCLFILVKNNKPMVLKIDEEYTGKNEFIGETLKKLFVDLKIKYTPELRFVRIGKRSPAHALAWKVHRAKGRLIGVKKISEKEVLQLIQRKEK